MIKFKDNIDDVERFLSDLAQRQLPFANSQALNDTAIDVKADEEKRLERDLDNPTPFTKRGLYIKRSTKSRLVAIVGFKPIQASYIKFAAKGGIRRPKRRALIVPVGQRLNKYGNMPRGSVKRAVSRPDTFSGKVKGVAGIWKRPRKAKRASAATGPKLLVSFKSRATYRPRHDFEGGAEKIARRVYPKHLIRRLEAAIKTAR